MYTLFVPLQFSSYKYLNGNDSFFPRFQLSLSVFAEEPLHYSPIPLFRFRFVISVSVRVRFLFVLRTMLQWMGGSRRKVTAVSLNLNSVFF
ncbi:hypothetical protein Lalb_Chr18g0054181 [Lupinus albus]|uniref:Uncharacterized protein n=1 Tax=Lupinus albus TaxID=3870 RepID=A0A6A4P2Q7_LUPAL|nr:hypothetical protein Lalb_Chr18g0054181 [Lupinus albus]